MTLRKLGGGFQEAEIGFLVIRANSPVDRQWQGDHAVAE